MVLSGRQHDDTVSQLIMLWDNLTECLDQEDTERHITSQLCEFEKNFTTHYKLEVISILNYTLLKDDVVLNTKRSLTVNTKLIYKSKLL